MVTLQHAPVDDKLTFNRKKVLATGDAKPFPDAAKDFGIRTKDFVTIYRNFGGTRQTGMSKCQPPTKSELVVAFKNKTNREVAEHFGVGYKTLVRWLKHYNLVQHIFTNDMLSLAAAAKELKVSRMTLSNWYRKGEIPGAVKINETRVMVPRATVNMLKLLHVQ